MQMTFEMTFQASSLRNSIKDPSLLLFQILYLQPKHQVLEQKILSDKWSHDHKGTRVGYKTHLEKEICYFSFTLEITWKKKKRNHLIILSVLVLLKWHRNENQLKTGWKLRYLRFTTLRPNFWSMYEWDFATYNPGMQNSTLRRFNCKWTFGKADILKSDFLAFWHFLLLLSFFKMLSFLHVLDQTLPSCYANTAVRCSVSSS